MDAGAHHLSFALIDLAAAQVAQAAGHELAGAGVADPHPAAERELEAGLLAGDEDRLAAVGLDLLVGLEELDRAALALAVAADDRLEALEVELVAVAVLLPVLLERVEQLGGAGAERLAVLPVRAQLLEVRRLEAPGRPRSSGGAR